MSEKLYNVMRERWIDFLDDQPYMPHPTDREQMMDNYDELAEAFCKKYGYSEKTGELAFHERWYDTFADEYYKFLEKDGFDGFPLPCESVASDKERKP